MPGYRPKTTSNPEKCLETRHTIKMMIRYMTSDDKIARHCGVKVAFVARVRKSLDPHQDACRKHRKIPASHTLGLDDDGIGEFARWCEHTRRSSEMLAAALGAT